MSAERFIENLQKLRDLAFDKWCVTVGLRHHSRLLPAHCKWLALTLARNKRKLLSELSKGVKINFDQWHEFRFLTHLEGYRLFASQRKLARDGRKQSIWFAFLTVLKHSIDECDPALRCRLWQQSNCKITPKLRTVSKIESINWAYETKVTLLF